MDHRLAEFIRLFNEKEFFEAHEVLEGLWMETDGEEKDFYKGLIQCAVAFVHLDRNNYRGALKLYTTSSQYLSRYLPEYGEVRTQQLLDQFEAFFTSVVRETESVDLDFAETPIIECT